MAENKSVKTKKQTAKNKKPKPQKNTDVKNIQNEFDQLKDRHIRLKAEFENFRKRKNKEISSLLQYDGEEIIKEILPIIDDIDRMVNSADKTNNNNKLTNFSLFQKQIKKESRSHQGKSHVCSEMHLV